MTGVLYGELTEDRERIVLLAEGDAWEMDQIGARLGRMTPLMQEALLHGQHIPEAPLTCPATWPAVVQLGFSFNGSAGLAWKPQGRLLDWIIAETTRRTSPPPPLPPGLTPPGKVLRPYQAEGAAMIADQGAFFLNDEPGTGKTAVIIAGIEARRRAGIEVFPLLIIVPSWSVGVHWQREIRDWAPGWPEPVLHAGPDRFGKSGSRRELPGSSVLITTFATLRLDAADARGPLVRLKPAAVVIDEAHLIKNHEAQQSLAAGRVAKHAATRIAATGTPVTQHTGDVYPPLEIVYPGAWPAWKRFKARYLATITNEYAEKITGLSQWTEPEFRAVMLGRMRRVAKADVLPQLPPKIHSVRYVQIPPEWRHAYDTMEADMLAALPDGGELPVFTTLTKFTRLSQLASSAADVEVTEEPDAWGELVRHYAVTLKAPSWKAEVLLEIMAERQGHPVACFTPSRQLAMIAGQYAEKAGLRTGYLVGLGQGVTNRTRQRDIDAFQAGKLDLICVSTKAGGIGVTLTAAGTGVFLQRPPGLGESIQAEDRAHRIGSEHHAHGVEFIDIVAENTVESRIRAMLRSKAGQLSEFVLDTRIVRELLGGIR